MAGGGSSDGDYGLQIAPMLDVMFVLLLFFMVMAGKQVKEAELGVQVPGRGRPQCAAAMMMMLMRLATTRFRSSNWCVRRGTLVAAVRVIISCRCGPICHMPQE